MTPTCGFHFDFRFKTHANLMYKFGTFTKIEDTLLILTVNKYRGYLARDGHFTELTSALPWRSESTWRGRAETLFNERTTPWTMLVYRNQMLKK